MQHSIVNYNKVKENLDFRIDADYYHPERLGSLKILAGTPFVLLNDFVLSVKKTELPKDSDVEVYDTGAASLHILTKNLAQTEERISLKKKAKSGDVIISRLRPYLKQVAYVPDFIGEAYLTTEFFILRSKGKENISFLVPFLLTTLVQKILFWSQGGTQHPRFQEYDLLNLPFPSGGFSLKEILNKTILKCSNLMVESNNFYFQAEELLLSELGLSDWKQKHELVFIQNFSDTQKAERFDAEYFQPKYEKLKSKIKNYGAKKLGELVSMKKGIEPGSEAYQDEGKLFIRVSSLSKNGIEDKDQKYLSEELYQKLKKDFEPKIGEILLTKDATPGIAYAVKEPIEGIISGGILRLKLKENIESEYLTLCINSIIVRFQAERDAGGSIIAHWKPEQIKNVLIPILPKPIQQKIVDLVQKSHQARKKAKELLEEAKQKVESLIEK